MSTFERHFEPSFQRAESSRASRLRALSGERSQLLKLMTQHKISASSRQEGLAKGHIPALARNGAVNMSFAQRRLWLADQKGPGTPLYNEHGALRMEGDLDVKCLENCVSEVMRRHEVLRTVFPWVHSRPHGEVVPQMEVKIPLIDLTHLEASEKDRELRRLATGDAHQPFDLVGGPLLRLQALRTGDREHFILVTMHHIVSDGWSLGVFVREINQFYAAMSQGRSHDLRDLAIQYSDFAHWQQQRMNEIKESQLPYWKNQLQDAPPFLELPTDFPETSVTRYSGSFESASLGPQLSKRLREFTRQYGMTPFGTLLATLKVLLHRYTGQDDLVVAVPIAGRNHVDLEPLIGFFVNVLPLRTRLSGEESFRQLMEQTRRTSIDVHSHQDLPFETVLQEVVRERRGGRTPFFDVFFNYANIRQQAVQLPGLCVTRVQLAEPIAKCPITFYVDDLGEDFTLRLLYQTELFSAGRIQSMLDQYSCLLAAVIDAPDAPINTHSLVTAASCKVVPNPSQPIVDETVPTVAELFLSQAARTPDLPAVAGNEHILTYKELASRARSIEQQLREMGLGKPDVVAITGARTPGLIAGLLGVLLNGSVVLPIDKKLPAKRKQLMLEQANAKAILWVGDRQSEIALEKPVAELVVADDGEYLGDTGASLLVAHEEISGDDPAYIFFTSGTTGTPKAVLGCHKGLGHFLSWQKSTFGVGPSDRCGQLVGLSFDVVLRDILLPLVSGATLHLPADPDDLSAEAALKWLSEENISIIHVTPSIVSSWLRRPSSGAALKDLRLVLFAGEPLSSTLVGRWRERFSYTGQVVNLYGPTETTLAKCFYQAPLQTDGLPSILPVGHALPQSQALVLGPNRRLCGISELGEIVIRTPFRSLGYMNGGAEENKRFVKNPFLNEENDLLYFTGDIGRYRADGALEIAGRLDDQIKVRGIRIEPGEIKTMLVRHPQVADCAVIPQKKEDGDYRLCAYVVRQHGSSISDSELRKYLAERLPAAMVPSTFIALSDLPLTANGKLDRRALPLPENLEELQIDSQVAPRTPEEEKLAMIFQSGLGKSQVGVHDNFFELGGHSLLAMELVGEIREAFHTPMPLKQLFETPTIAGLAEVLTRKPGQGMPPSQVALPELVVDVEHRHDPFPLTDIQQAYWVGRSSSFELGNVATHNYSEFEFTDLDTDRMNDAVLKLVERHDMLRAVVTSEGDQRILAKAPHHEIEIQDLRDRSQSEREASLLQIRQRLSHQVLELDQWPLFEIAVSRIDERRSLIHLSMDALICDAWSRRLLGRELLHFYRNPEVPLPPLDLSFRDYVIADVQLREQTVYKKSQEYWLERLANLPPAPEIPLAKNPGSLSHPRFVRLQTRLEPEVWLRMKAHATRKGLTPSGMICAAYAELLGMWSKSPEFSINLTLFNRLPLHRQVNQIIGDFTSLVVVAIQPSQLRTFELRARKVQQQLWDDLDHRYFSGVRVLRELNRKQGSGGRALMPIVLTSALFGDGQGTDDLLHAWQRNMAYGISQTPQVFLDHGVSEQAGALVVTWDFIEELFPSGMVAEMFAAYERLLRCLGEDEANWRTEGFGHLLLGEQLTQRNLINATKDFVPEGLLHGGFLKQTQVRPDATAVISPGRKISYQQLRQEANQLADRLKRIRVRANELVAVVMEKGWEQVVAVLGILQAGAAYLPIEAGLPEARREQLMEQGRVRVVITQPWLRNKLGWPQGVTALLAIEPQAPSSGAVRCLAHTKPLDLAYVIFTSGSTGVPKGVMVDHRAALNTILDMNQRFGLSAQDRVLALSSLSFDLSVYDVFGTLAAGGAIVLPPADAKRDPRRWMQQLDQEQVTIWNTVPALLEMLVEYAEGAGLKLPSGLRLALLSGDWIPVTLPGRARALQPLLNLISLGGATEAAIWSILYPIEEVPFEWKSIPYGRPMKNQYFTVLHENFTPCPIWVPGQLYIGGIGLAQGYWRDPRRTADRFVPHPEQAERLYRTGDLGRYLPDGTIEFLGREDFQVKVQGHRIETGEIESSLEQHPDVRQAIVNAVGELRGPKKLVAYVVPRQGCELQPEALRQFLATQLPSYMVPAAIIVKDSLPLSQNGKVDRSALLGTSVVMEESQAPVLTPRSSTEEAVTSLWEEVLGHKPSSPLENFFSAGGDSVSAIKLLSRINKIFGIEVPVRELFERPALEDLTRAVENRKESAQKPEIPAAASTDSGEYPLSFAQERLWFLCQLEPKSPFYNLPITVRLKGRLELPALQSSLDEVAKRQEILRTGFPSTRGRISPFVSEEARLPLEVQSGNAEDPEEISRIIREEVRRIFDLATPPLCRAKIIQLSAEEHILVLTIHHLVSDARSLEILIQQLATIYEGRVKGEDSTFSKLRFQYKDFARRQKKLFRDGALRQQLAYWKQQLGGTLPVFNLPYDSPLPSTQSLALRAARERFHLPSELSANLAGLAQDRGGTLYMVLLAAYSVLLSSYTGENDAIVSTSVSNRTGTETESLIGLFLNTILMRSRISPQLAFRELLAQVQKVALDAYAHQDIPFEEVIKAILSDRKLNHAPITPVAFGFRNSPPALRKIGDLQLTPLEITVGTAKFDWELQLVRREEGIHGYLEFNRDRFRSGTITAVLNRYRRILEEITLNPEISVGNLMDIVAKDAQVQGLKAKAKAARPSLTSIKPKPVPLAPEEQVNIATLPGGRTLPLAISAKVDVDLGAWIKGNRKFVEDSLLRHGALLFRNFKLSGGNAFETIVSQSHELLEYAERSTPRRRVTGRIYTSTEYPPDQCIPMHNENSYSHTWPMKIWFFCELPAASGGETPIVDSRRVYLDLDPALRERFEQKKVLYVRNFNRGLGLTWQEAFQTDEKAVVEAYCSKHGIRYEWPSPEHFRTYQVRQASVRHPATGEMIWFNQANLFHVNSLHESTREPLLAVLKEQDLPRNSYYGDGTPIEKDELQHIANVYCKHSVSFTWKRGDLLMLDNMLVAHGRMPFSGPRRILVAMAEPTSIQ
jgi:amino acid adenylation domain-containing protein